MGEITIVLLQRDLGTICGILEAAEQRARGFIWFSALLLSLKGHFEVYCTQVIL